ncbi:MAG: hypothetical protein N2690_04730 [Rhodocyclaceae bacterium]|nr:hypothetical protein [Rhodocyclaceae bacterium]
MNFKSRALPAQEVEIASGLACQQFARRPTRTETAPPAMAHSPDKTRP